MMEAATYGECPVCRAKEGEFCNPEQGAYGTHYGRVRMAQEDAAHPGPALSSQHHHTAQEE